MGVPTRVNVAPQEDIEIWSPHIYTINLWRRIREMDENQTTYTALILV